ncbi:MAG: amidohydrolase family protein [Treponema sp.]|jgi:predicted TIM-barrel fold metal-dependent hydrolase|nr:amidohydrolase family protein [Treponema sp.]
MLIDCHVHTHVEVEDKGALLKSMDEAGVDKMILFSNHPASFYNYSPEGKLLEKKMLNPAETLKAVMDWSAYSDRIIPFFWIDPLESDAIKQVDRAIDAGIRGFKVICNRHFPCDEKPMEVWTYIAQKGKPILFHSGILYGPGASSRYNRPVGFEKLLEIPRLRFALAHVSWPWHDENLSMYGHYRSMLEQGTTNAEMFIDTTPGTPKIYRNEVLGKVYTIGYDLEDNVIFGTDCNNNYNSGYTKDILAMDKEALDLVKTTQAQRDKYYYKNVLRFIGC